MNPSANNYHLMDSSSPPPPPPPPHHNWLGFSLSNHHHAPNHLSLFEAFNPAPGGVVDRDEDARPHGHGPTDLSIFSGGGPKLEDFLGGSATTGGAQPLLAHFAAAPEAHHPPVAAAEAYDSELKTIAASFLRGYTAEQADVIVQKQQQPQQQQQPLASSEEAGAKKTVDTFGQRTSIYRGVTRHRWTGRYEAHLWDNSCRREGQSRKGRQVYLGGYDKEDRAARAYDLAALKYWGPTTTTNFPISNYEKELEEMKHMTRQEFVASLRRKSSGFSRGASIYRGVTRHHQHGRWQARIGRVAGNKDLYLGTFSTQEEAAEAYDIAAIKFRGLNAVTNFDMSRYDVKSIMSSNLPIGGMSGKSKNSSDSTSESRSIEGSRSDDRDLSSASSLTFASSQPPPMSTLSFAIPVKADPSDCWPNGLGYHQNPSNPLNGAKLISTGRGPSPLLAFYQSFESNQTAFSADFLGSQSSNHNGCFNGGGYGGNIHQHHQEQESNHENGSSGSNSIPFAAPSTLYSSGNHENGNGYNSWMASAGLHSFQTAKQNLAVFQTPIFGME
ncbi:hypothetical protein NL676_034700 [Syzygium grande]|nr:hypothetical protein NL676_034700 [Syzygium grande]